MKWVWKKRNITGEPQGLIGFGDTKIKLAKRLLAEQEDMLRTIYAVSAPECLIIFGDKSWLPWVTNISYICRSIETPDLWLPTVSTPNISHSLLLQRIQNDTGKTSVLIWPDPKLVIPLNRQYFLSRDYLNGIIEN